MGTQFHRIAHAAHATPTFDGIACQAAQDVFDIVAPATSNVVIREIKIGQYTDFGGHGEDEIKSRWRRLLNAITSSQETGGQVRAAALDYRALSRRHRSQPRAPFPHPPSWRRS